MSSSPSRPGARNPLRNTVKLASLLSVPTASLEGLSRLPAEQLLALEALADEAARAIERETRSPADTERQRDFETAYKQSEAFYHSLVETLPQNIFRKDIEGRHTFANSRYCETLGVTLEQVLGKTNGDLFDAELAAKYTADDERVMRTGEIHDVVEEHQTPTRRMFVQVIKTPVRDDTGRVIGTQGIFWDVTERKTVEADLAIARDMAVESARLKSQFLANMSHEIRTPLNAVVGMAGLMLDTELDADQRDFAETIRTSADLLLGIINDILDFSKIEAGKMVIETVDFDLTHVVEETADLVAGSAQMKGVELLTSIAPDAVRLLRGDPGRIRQVLANLLSNAVKFTEKGEVVVDVVATAVSETAVNLLVRVRDTGIGIPATAQAQLFSAFTQADGSMTRKYGGTGLGLAISKQLVTLMGGEIGVDSAPGRGSTFWFRLPMERQASRTTVALDPISLENVRVLIADDNTTNRDILRRQTTAWRMRPDTATSGAEGLAALYRALADDPYRLVVLDMQMPDMDGVAVSRAIRADPRLSSTRVVILTSLGHHPDERNLAEIGVAAYLTKPVKQSRLFDALVSAMARPPAAGAVRNADPSPARVTSGARPAPRARGLRVLVAEDNPINQRVALQQLARLGVAADAVGDGEEVLAAIQRMPYDILFMDCQMPRVDGYEATRRIRRREAAEPLRPRHHIIAITAHALDGDRESCLAAGMDDYLSKPIRLDDLARALDAYQRRTHAAGPHETDHGAAARRQPESSGAFNRG